MGRRVNVIGVGMVKFAKPGASDDYHVMAGNAIGAAREYRWKYGTKKETFGKISEKARKHASNNPYALFNQVLSLDEVMASEEVFDPLTRFQCCPPTCGAAAAILCSDDFAKKHKI